MTKRQGISLLYINTEQIKKHEKKHRFKHHDMPDTDRHSTKGQHRNTEKCDKPRTVRGRIPAEEVDGDGIQRGTHHAEMQPSRTSRRIYYQPRQESHEYGLSGLYH